MAESNNTYKIETTNGIVTMKQEFNGNNTPRDVIDAYLKIISNDKQFPEDKKEICEAFYSIQDGKELPFYLMAGAEVVTIDKTNADKTLNELFPKDTEKTIILVLQTPQHECTNEQTFQVTDVRGNKHLVDVSVTEEIDISKERPDITISHLTDKLHKEHLWDGNTQYITVNGKNTP